MATRCRCIRGKGSIGGSRWAAQHFNPRLGRDDLRDSAVQALSLGLNASAGSVRASIFGTLSRQR